MLPLLLSFLRARNPTIPTRKVDGLNEEQKRCLCVSLNVARRQLTEQERQQLVEARRQRVKEATKAGKSLRTIAEEERVGHEQVPSCSWTIDQAATWQLRPVNENRKRDHVRKPEGDNRPYL